VALGEGRLGIGALGEQGSGEGPVGAAEDKAGAGQPPVWRSVPWYYDDSYYGGYYGSCLQQQWTWNGWAWVNVC